MPITPSQPISIVSFAPVVMLLLMGFLDLAILLPDLLIGGFDG